MSDPQFTTVGFYRSAWLIVARGGWWTVPEIIEHLPPAIDAWDAYELLWCMAHRNGMLVTRGRGKARQYAVTPECRMPRGICAGEAVQALTGLKLQGVAA